MFRTVELFSGCGGLALGLCKAGIVPLDMVEIDRSAFKTLMHNKNRGLDLCKGWPIRNVDVRAASWIHLKGQVDVVAGGPPCQPFSIAGNHLGKNDERDMWPEAIRAVREMAPRAFLFENVRGLLRTAFSDYLRSIKSQLREPMCGLRYSVGHIPVNAADYGAAQQRHRVIIYGYRNDVRASATPPLQTHSLNALLWEQWVTGEYWRRHGLSQPSESHLPKLLRGRVARLRSEETAPTELPWRTVRDALLGLEAPGREGNHELRTGARSYPGHTGSTYDFPAKALKAGAHGVPGGENMLRRADGTVRYFTIREAARLQGIPDEIEFPGSWCENMRQLGNAVPVELAKTFACWVKEVCLQSDPTSLAA
ncbi:MAG TPA: DNA (cytosine-5-)-methyltransferase [Acetobacteraceae bacterium]|nr:DNA (cytosine-5-)-methyltransferase [Acetobacteraceae bacterium]